MTHVLVWAVFATCSGRWALFRVSSTEATFLGTRICFEVTAQLTTYLSIL